VSWYQKGKTNLDFTEARDSEWQWHQLGRMQVCTSLQTDNHASLQTDNQANTSPLSFLQARCPSCRPTNSVKALKALTLGSHTVCLKSLHHISCNFRKNCTILIFGKASSTKKRSIKLSSTSSTCA